MTKLIVCCDGTWNTPEQEDNGRPAPTNVFKIKTALARDDGAGEEQSAYYRTGVGTSGGLFRRITGGGLGVGLGDDVKSAYKWLCESYAPGDRIFLFGFSRGAYAVRSLAGLMNRCSLLDFSALGRGEKAKWKGVEGAYEAYRRRTPAETFRARHAVHDGVTVDFMGVWDTVGALGIPDEFVANIFDRPQKFRFHDTVLGENVKVARHAVAVDERRQAFTPTLWSETPADSDVSQVWFAGVHGDVGGSYADAGLGHITLSWMMDEAEAQGLRFREAARKQVDPDPQGDLHDSVRGIFARLRTRPRSTPDLQDQAAPVHASVRSRIAEPPLIQPDYWPTRRLAPGETAELGVWAREHWNATGLYLKAGAEYEFAASGEWLDASVKSGPAGTRDGTFQPGEVIHLLGTPLGWAERLIRKGFGTPDTEVALTRREDSLPWMCLVGVVANAQGVDPRTRHAARHESFAIGAGTHRRIETGGYLYCFANDAWHAYGNNKGGVALSVTRTG